MTAPLRGGRDQDARGAGSRDADASPQEPRPELAFLTHQERDAAMDRYRLLAPFLTDGVALERVAEVSGLPVRTLRRWVRRYRSDGLVCLARKGRADHGRRLSDDLRLCTEGLALQRPRLSAAEIHRIVCGAARAIDEPLPSYSLVYAVVRALPPGLLTLAHEGARAYHQVFDLLCRREADAPNAIWQADHTPLDILLLRDAKPPAKPWLTIVIDDYSRAIAGYFLSFEAPSSLHTSLALRQAIWRKPDPRWHVCGIPAVLYSDNGSDFTSQHLEQVSADLKVRLVFSTPGMPRGRGRVERFFDTVNQMLLSPLPGYSLPDGPTRGAPQLTMRSFEPLLLEFILGTYHVRVHGETGGPPQTRWEDGGFLPQMPDSLEQLDLLLLTVAKARKVHPDGIRFQGLRYTDIGLAAYVGEGVVIRYDPRDVAEVRVFHAGRFICRAVCQELAGETIPLREIIRARNQRRGELRRMIRDRQRMVDTLLDARRWSETPGDEPRSEPSPASEPAQIRRYRNE